MRTYLLPLLLLLAGCPGTMRSCDSSLASEFGANWIVVQYDSMGQPFNCWRLNGVSIANESASDGIYWVDSKTGNLVHISGWYNRVQVGRFGKFEDAAPLLGIDLELCANGRYLRRIPQIIAGPAEVQHADAGHTLNIVVPPPMGMP